LPLLPEEKGNKELKIIGKPLSPGRGVGVRVTLERIFARLMKQFVRQTMKKY
jgi:hypothetical protein